MKRYRLYLYKFFKRLRDQWQKLPKLARIVIGLVILGGSVYWIISNPIYHASEDGTPTEKQSNAALKSTNGNLTKGTPEYKTYVPSGKSIESLGGWTRVSPPERNPVYAYNDSIAGTPIIVSQQPIPKEFKPDVDSQVSDLAKGYHADHFITVDNAKVYIGTSAKGPQSVILVKGETLILIKASAKLSDDQWTGYVHTLR
jgi:hypothetical protein